MHGPMNIKYPMYFNQNVFEDIYCDDSNFALEALMMASPFHHTRDEI